MWLSRETFASRCDRGISQLWSIIMTPRAPPSCIGVTQPTLFLSPTLNKKNVFAFTITISWYRYCLLFFLFTIAIIFIPGLQLLPLSHKFGLVFIRLLLLSLLLCVFVHILWVQVYHFPGGGGGGNRPTYPIFLWPVALPFTWFFQLGNGRLF